jgi:tetratricopeptide (TPR) repeat protein
MPRPLIAPVWVSLLFAVAAAAQDAPAPPSAAEFRPASAVGVSAGSERKLHEAFEHLYNLDFRPALQLFEEVAKAEPESAAACAFWSSALLYEILAHQGSLQSQLFVTTNEFLRYPRLPVDPKLDSRYHSVSQEGETRAKRRLKRDPKDVDALFALGLLYGNQANYLAGVKAEYFRGLRLGEKAYDIHARLRQLHPELHDTGVVLGVRQYVIGILPRTTRFLLFFVGARGSRERGLEYIRDVAANGEYLRTYAQILLTVASIREHDLDTAASLAKDLSGRYPRNPIFRLELTKLYRQQQRYEEARLLARELLADLTAHPHNPRVVGPEDALLELGLIEAGQGQFELALESLRRVGIFPGASKRAQAEALLERGKIYDTRGQRDQAVNEYEKVIRLAADPGSVRQAESYRKRPYQEGAEGPQS